MSALHARVFAVARDLLAGDQWEVPAQGVDFERRADWRERSGRGVVAQAPKRSYTQAWSRENSGHG